MGVAIPVPPPHVTDEQACRVYVRYATVADAQKCKQMNDGRDFDNNKVKASYVTDMDFSRAQANEWI